MTAAAHTEWMDVAIILVAWATGMAFARKRGRRRAEQVLFTITMFVMLAIGLWPARFVPITARIPTAFWILFLAAWLALIGWRFHRRGLTLAFIPLALGLSAMWFGLLFISSLGEAVAYPLEGVGLLLLLISIPLSARRRRPRNIPADRP